MTLRVGIIGAARVATYAMIAPARDDPRVGVAAVAARDPTRARAYAAEHGIAVVHDSYAALAADPDIDLVYVATPPRFHLEHARLGLAAGKPVLVEKPFTMTAGEAGILLGEARAAGLPVFEAMHSRHHAIWPQIAGLLPRIGRLRTLDAVFDVAVSTDADEFRWDASLGGGALMDLGIYPLAWVRAIGGEPLAVTRAEMRRGRGVDAAFSATLAMADGVIATVAADMTAPFRSRLAITGDAGTMTVMNPLAPHMGSGIALELQGTREDFAVTGPSSYAAQLSAIAATLIDGAGFALTADDPLASMQAIERVRAAAEPLQR